MEEESPLEIEMEVSSLPVGRSAIPSPDQTLPRATPGPGIP